MSLGFWIFTKILGFLARLVKLWNTGFKYLSSVFWKIFYSSIWIKQALNHLIWPKDKELVTKRVYLILHLVSFFGKNGIFWIFGHQFLILWPNEMDEGLFYSYWWVEYLSKDCTKIFETSISQFDQTCQKPENFRENSKSETQNVTF